MIPQKVYNIQGSKMYLDDKDSLGLATNGIYDVLTTNFIPLLVDKNTIALDIGANIGYFTLILAKLCTHVYAFEPDPANYRILTDNIIINMKRHIMCNVTSYPNAVSDSNGIDILHLCDSNKGMHRLYHSKWCNSVDVPVKTLRIDDVVDCIHFIKMDIEGAEVLALRGMEKLLTNNDIKMIMEYHKESILEYGATPKDIYDFMDGLGYRMVELSRPSFKLSLSDLENIEDSVNLLCSKTVLF